jgi:D-glycero-D-manno-heptose 1,7-bisphosphate phosphatase
MLLQAALEHDLDLQHSFMVGDKLADIEAGKRAGCKSFLVLTGYGATTALRSEAEAVQKCRDLDCAATVIINNLITKESP